MFTTIDERFMTRALTLARKGRGRTSPNPMVGAVIARDGRIIGEGYHARPGGPHAEVVALDVAEGETRGADLYVTLEPCCHQGRTPPCVDRIISGGIRRVVTTTLDPNPLVSGRGVERLRASGISTEVGLLSDDAMILNEAYMKFTRSRVPFVILKAAVSLDGRIGTRTGDSHWISGERSRQRVHELRDEVDAVLVGIGTIRRDDPQLTARLPGGGRDPIRVIVDGLGEPPLSAQVFHSASSSPTWVAVAAGARPGRIEAYERLGLTVLEAGGSHGRVCLKQLVKQLGDRDITSILIEGGAGIFTSAIEEGVIDKFLVFVCSLLIGGRTAPSLFGGLGIEHLAQAVRLRRLRFERLEDDLLIEGYLSAQGACG